MPDHRLTPEIETVLRASRIEGNSLTLQGQLARPLYEKVAAFLLNCGGKWQRGRGCHVFDKPAAQAVGLALDAGVAKDEKKAKQAFYTPPALAARVVKLADVSGHRVLEPSAGHGALVKECLAQGAIEVRCFDNDEMAIPKLEAIYRANPSHLDFLRTSPTSLFPRIVMNPPFTSGTDIKHVQHALKWLAPGGRLVAIMSPNSNPKERLLIRADATVVVEKIPAGAFKESGTSIATIILTVEVP